MSRQCKTFQGSLRLSCKSSAASERAPPPAASVTAAPTFTWAEMGEMTISGGRWMETPNRHRRPSAVLGGRGGCPWPPACPLREAARVCQVSFPTTPASHHHRHVQAAASAPLPPPAREAAMPPKRRAAAAAHGPLWRAAPHPPGCYPRPCWHNGRRRSVGGCVHEGLPWGTSTARLDGWVVSLLPGRSVIPYCLNTCCPTA